MSQAQFSQHFDYSDGSIRDQIKHLINVDDAWFCDLRGIEMPEPLIPTVLQDRNAIRTSWDAVERETDAFLAGLRADSLSDQPLSGEDKNFCVWQVLLHVVYHGTDHRAQILRCLHDL